MIGHHNPALAHRAASPYDFIDADDEERLARYTVEAVRGGPPVEERRVYGAAVPTERGTLLAYHVTDDPDEVLRELKAGSELSVVRQTGDLGGGLYVSAIPHMWRGRSRARWAWVDEIDDQQVARLIEIVAAIIERARETRYLSAGEYESAVRDIERAGEEMAGTIESATPRAWLRAMIHRVANQPYNVQFHRDILPEIGVAYESPAEVEVEIEGRFIDVDALAGEAGYRLAQRIQLWAAAGGEAWMRRTMGAFGQADELRNAFLRAIDLDGIFARSGFSWFPQLVVWNVASIRRFGRWRNPRPLYEVR